MGGEAGGLCMERTHNEIDELEGADKRSWHATVTATACRVAGTCAWLELWDVARPVEALPCVGEADKATPAMMTRMQCHADGS